MISLISAAVLLFAGAVIGYFVAPRINRDRMFRAYCQGKLKARHYRDDEINKLTQRIWRLEAINRQITLTNTAKPIDQINA